jgi:hypothetical protein
MGHPRADRRADLHGGSYRALLKEAAEAGFYKPPGLEDRYPRIQILTIEELLAGKGVAYPRLLEVTFKKAPKARKATEEQMPLGGTEIEEPFYGVRGRGRPRYTVTGRTP